MSTNPSRVERLKRRLDEETESVPRGWRPEVGDEVVGQLVRWTSETTSRGETHPILILALADASAAIVGKVLPFGQLTGIASGKSTAGCIAFFIVAFIVSFWSLEFFADLQLNFG